MSAARELGRTVFESLRFGGADPRLTLISYALVAALIALAALVVLFGHAAWRSMRERGPAGLPVRDARARAGFVAAIVVSLALLLGLGSHYLSRPAVCARCHASWSQSTVGSSHEGVSCVSCHRDPGVLGFVAGHVDYARWLTATLRAGGFEESDERRYHVRLSNRSCVRCHADVTSDVVEDDAIRVRHEDFLERPCIDCHNVVGHGDRVRIPARATMNICLTCHDARQVSAECGMCHVGDVARAARRTSPRAAPIKVAAPTGTDCRGCHDTASCNECHGTEMPHPPDWMPGHARPAFEWPDICWRCHASGELRSAGPPPYSMCNRCHRFPGPHGPTEQWVARHGAAAAKEPGVFGRTRCRLCHTNERFCDLCHDGRSERVDYE